MTQAPGAAPPPPPPVHTVRTVTHVTTATRCEALAPVCYLDAHPGAAAFAGAAVTVLGTVAVAWVTAWSVGAEEARARRTFTAQLYRAVRPLDVSIHLAAQGRVQGDWPRMSDAFAGMKRSGVVGLLDELVAARPESWPSIELYLAARSLRDAAKRCFALQEPSILPGDQTWDGVDDDFMLLEHAMDAFRRMDAILHRPRFRFRFPNGAQSLRSFCRRREDDRARQRPRARARGHRP